MYRMPTRLAACLGSAMLLIAAVPRAQEPATDDVAKRLGFYFDLSLERLSQHGQANGIGIVSDPITPERPGPSGSEVNGDFQGRFTLGTKVGFRLRQNHGRIELSYLQWDEKKDLLTQAPDGKVIYNTMASPSAGYYEDQGTASLGVPGPPDGLVEGYESGTISEVGSEDADGVRDGAEDVNFNRTADFIRFDTSDEIVGKMSTNYRVFDADYVRKLKQVKRFTLDGRAGVRWAALEQNMDVAYRQHGSFAAFSDDEGKKGLDEGLGCDLRPPPGPDTARVQDGDGDFFEGGNNVSRNEQDGDGFMDGNCSSGLKDQITSVETVSEDRIVANVDAEGYGLKLGLDGRFQLSRKWSFFGGFAVTGLSSSNEFRYTETFTSERDRFLNFVDWDLNGDGQYNNLDLDFDGDCNGVLAGCIPDNGDSIALDQAGGVVAIRTRLGAQNSVVQNPAGLTTGASTNYSRNQLVIGQAVGEAERNRDILTETQLLHDVSGKSTGISPILDLHLGMSYQFSKFASMSFGFRASRWYGAGSFRSIADDVIASGTADVSGDFKIDGYYFMLTVVPR